MTAAPGRRTLRGMGSVIHEGAKDPYGLTYTFAVEGLDLSTAASGRFEVRMPDRSTERVFVATLSGVSASSVTLDYEFADGDLAGQQGVGRFVPVVVLADGEEIAGTPRSFRVRHKFDM